jgi:type II secretory pathway pseudopilin PulG
MKNYPHRDLLDIRHFLIPSSFVIRNSSFYAAGAFTILELLVVISILVALAALVLATAGYVQKKAARSRAESELAAISAALESYKADNGIYPTDPVATEQVDPAVSPTPAAASHYLYERLSGDLDDDRVAERQSYFVFKPNQLNPTDQTQHVAFIRDPFGNTYGYSTMRAAGGSAGYNPTFDLWSTGSANPIDDQSQWIKNW